MSQTVILRGCDFFGFPLGLTLKTKELQAENPEKTKKVTNSEH